MAAALDGFKRSVAEYDPWGLKGTTMSAGNVALIKLSWLACGLLNWPVGTKLSGPLF